MQTKGYLVTSLREGILTARTELCADRMRTGGAPLDGSVSFIDCQK